MAATRTRRVRDTVASSSSPHSVPSSAGFTWNRRRLAAGAAIQVYVMLQHDSPVLVVLKHNLRIVPRQRDRSCCGSFQRIDDQPA